MRHPRNVLEIYEKIDFDEKFITECDKRGLAPNSVEVITNYITAFLGEVNIDKKDAIAIAEHHVKISKLTTKEDIEAYKKQHLNYDIPVGNTAFWLQSST